jgi:hypothetical protein
VSYIESCGLFRVSADEFVASALGTSLEPHPEFSQKQQPLAGFPNILLYLKSQSPKTATHALIRRTKAF